MSKITEEQLESIKESQGKINAILAEIGFLETKKVEFIGAHFEAVKVLEEIKSELKEEYGDINVNLNDGTFEKIETEVKEMEVVK
jgi:hypothetical protein|tara:strand:- start:631 stop:885 length:255 start_codon:yes stop_codon:yes gene_type:complete